MSYTAEIDSVGQQQWIACCSRPGQNLSHAVIKKDGEVVGVAQVVVVGAAPRQSAGARDLRAALAPARRAQKHRPPSWRDQRASRGICGAPASVLAGSPLAVRLLPKRWRRPCSPSAPGGRSDCRPSPTSSICPAPKASYGAVCRRSANRAFYLHGADGNASLELRAGYILQWAIVRWLKERSLCRWYDLNGAMSSPGVRQFKRGLVGARAREIAVTDYDACESPLAALVIRSGRQWNERFRRFWLRPKRINR